MHRCQAVALAIALAAAGACRPPPVLLPDAGDLDAGETDADAGPPFGGDDVQATITLATTSTLHCTVLGLATVYTPATNVLEIGCAQSGASIALRFPVAVGESTAPAADARIEAVDELGVAASSEGPNVAAASFSLVVTAAAAPAAPAAGAADGRAAGTFTVAWDDDGTNPAGTASGSFDVDFLAP